MKRKLPFFSQKYPENQEVPWIEKFLPETIDELAVHKKKVAEVESWFHTFFHQNEVNKVTPILLLTGPPGAGKTSTIKAISKKLKAELFVWSNSWHETSKSALDTEENFLYKSSYISKENQTSAFSSFLLRSTRYSLFQDVKKVILFEEFPNAFLRDSSLFQIIIKKYSIRGRCPAVFIISDSVKGESVESTLFPKDFQLSLKISNISFNPIAPTMMLKVLTRINSKNGSVCRRLNKTQLEGIAADSMGDIRNAINSLQFLCLSQTSKVKMKSHSKSGANNKTNESESQDTKKDSSLFLFHALGKILYCKRDASLKTEKDILPLNMKHLEKDPPLSNPEDVFEKTSISADGFCLFLQENFLSFTKDINATAECSRWISEADMISAYWDGTGVMTEYLAPLVARGLMFNVCSSAAENRWRPLHKPQFYGNNSKKNQVLKTLKKTFKERGMSLFELQTDFIPFVSKIGINNLPLEQKVLIKDLGEMKVIKQIRSYSKSLQEKDLFSVETEEENVDDAICEDANSTDVNLQLLDEEIIIEEYDF